MYTVIVLYYNPGKYTSGNKNTVTFYKNNAKGNGRSLTNRPFPYIYSLRRVENQSKIAAITLVRVLSGLRLPLSTPKVYCSYLIIS